MVVSKGGRKRIRPISNLSIVLIAIVVVSVVTTVVATGLLGLWQPFGQVVGSGKLVTKDF